MTIITKAGLATELGCSRSRITQLVESGMPVRADGRLDRAAALKWLKDNASGSGGGWSGETRRRPSIAERAEKLAPPADVVTKEARFPANGEQFVSGSELPAIDAAAVFRAGAHWMAEEVRVTARRTFPDVLSLIYDGAPDLRAAMQSAVLSLVESLLTDFLRLRENAPAGNDEAFRAGGRWMARTLCSRIRTDLPRLVVALHLDCVPDERVAWQAWLCVLLRACVEDWLRYFVHPLELPQADYSVFGAMAEVVQRQAEIWSRPAEDDALALDSFLTFLAWTDANLSRQ